MQKCQLKKPQQNFKMEWFGYVNTSSKDLLFYDIGHNGGIGQTAILYH